MTSLVVKCLPTLQETRVQSLGQEDLLDKEVATHSSTLAWKTPWMKEPGRLQSVAKSQTSLSDFTHSLNLDGEKHRLSIHQPVTGNEHFLESQMSTTTHSNISSAWECSTTEISHPFISPSLQVSGNITYQFSSVQSLSHV